MSSEIYNKLSERLGFPSSEYLPRILEKMLTPEEGEVLIELRFQPDEIARKLSIDENEVKRRLEGLRQRGIIYPANVVWPFMKATLFGPTFEQLRAMYLLTADKFMSAEALGEYMDMLKEFYKAEWCKDQGEFYAKNDALAMRVIPARKAFPSTAEISPEKILPDEDVKGILEKAKLISVFPCVCKLMWRTCDAPLEVCLQFDEWAEYTMSRGGGRKVSLEEALAISDSAEEAGLVHTVTKAVSIVMCNCCADCCIVMDPARKAGTMNKAITKSHYRSTIDQDSCIGCEDCIDRCPFDAIKMEKDSSREPKAVVDEEKCYGCGVCVIACPPEAITMKLIES